MQTTESKNAIPESQITIDAKPQAENSLTLYISI